MSISTTLWDRLLLIGIAGGFGAMARYALGRWIMILSGGGFPWGTLAVNVMGCAIFGLIWGLAEVHGVIPERIRILLLVGFLGAFTTFSSFAYETVVLLNEHRWGLAGINIIANNVLSLAGFAVGMLSCRLFSFT